MTAEGAKEFEALEAQAASLMTLFSFKGYERVAQRSYSPRASSSTASGKRFGRARTFLPIRTARSFVFAQT